MWIVVGKRDYARERICKCFNCFLFSSLVWPQRQQSFYVSQKRAVNFSGKLHLLCLTGMCVFPQLVQTHNDFLDTG